MDDAISTIIYLVLTLIIVLGGLLGRKKKASRPSVLQQDNDSSSNADRPEPKSTKDVNPIDQFFSSFIDEHAPEESYDPEPVELEVPRAGGDKSHRLDVVSDEEGVSVFSYDDPSTPMVETQPLEDAITEEEKVAMLEDLTSAYQAVEEPVDEAWEFDLRQAIIYSEILKPKF
jgi:hypothetical protein